MSLAQTLALSCLALIRLPSTVAALPVSSPRIGIPNSLHRLPPTLLASSGPAGEAGAQRTQVGPQTKTREDTTNDNQCDNTTEHSPDACAFPIRKKTNTSFTDRNTSASNIQKTKGVARAREHVQAHLLQMGSLPLSIYIYM